MSNDFSFDRSNVNEPEVEKLNLSTKIAYGAGDMGPAITANILVFFCYISLLMWLVYLRVWQGVF